MNMQPFKLRVPRNENEDDILKPCFKIGSGVELKEVPTTGEEYLLKVMNERQHYAVITTCTQDVSEFAKNQDTFIEEIPKASVCDKLKPTIEWQNIQVADFSDVRMYLSRLRATKVNFKDRIQELPREPIGVRDWKRVIQHTEPTLSIVLGLKNAQVDLGLEKVTLILNETKPGKTIEYRTGMWIYALLACVVTPLLSETTCILRDLARRCAIIRSNLDPEAENAVEAAAPMNIFICLVARYFRQFDLAD